MTHDTQLIHSISLTPHFDGGELLLKLGIDEAKVQRINEGQEALSSAENILLSILSRNPEVLSGYNGRLGDLGFSVSSKYEAAFTIDQKIQSLLDELEQERIKNGATKEEFMYGNKNNNSYRRRVNDFFQSLHAQDLMAKDAARCYQTSFWKSFLTGELFKRSNFGNR